MNHQNHVALIKDGIVGSVWADLGAGTGAFTLALADCLGGQGTIYAVDQDKHALDQQKRVMQEKFPDMDVHYVVSDFARKIDFPPLDGVVMANSLHFQREKNAVLQLVRSYLKPSGRLVIVEYNADKGNMWVPYPFSYETWEKMSKQNGFAATQYLSSYPSRFLNEIYSALSLYGD